MYNQGGLIHDIPDNKLLDQKPDKSLPPGAQRLVNLITIHDPSFSDITRLGSSTFAVQKYWSDLDINNVFKEEGNIDQVAHAGLKNIRKLVKEIVNQPDVYFSDFKAGVDENGNALHWTADQILDTDNIWILTDALKQKSVIKLDIIAPLGDRFIEASTFFILAQVDSENNIKNILNLPDDFIEQFQNNLRSEISKYANTKPFKAIKRLWSLSRIRKDIPTLKKIVPLIDSNLSLLSRITADMETLILLLEKVSDPPVKDMARSVSQFKENLSTIADIKLPLNEFDMLIDKLVLLLIGKFNKSNRREAISLLKSMHDYLLKIINIETLDYLRHINFNFDDYL